MKKLFLTITLALFLFSCDDMNMDQENENKSTEQGSENPNKSPEQGNGKPKIYRVIYDGNGNTEGEVPIDDNLYAEGDTVPVKWNYKLYKMNETINVKIGIKAWQVNGAGPASTFFYSDDEKNIFLIDYYRGMLVIGNSDIELIAVYSLSGY
jgi:hypothetical protein